MPQNQTFLDGPVNKQPHGMDADMQYLWWASHRRAQYLPPESDTRLQACGEGRTVSRSGSELYHLDSEHAGREGSQARIHTNSI